MALGLWARPNLAPDFPLPLVDSQPNGVGLTGQVWMSVLDQVSFPPASARQGMEGTSPTLLEPVLAFHTVGSSLLGALSYVTQLLAWVVLARSDTYLKVRCPS